MYIHKTFNLKQDNQSTSYYKKELKVLNPINLRRSSKFNVLAVLGAIQCMEGYSFSDNMGIYVASEYGSIHSVKKVVEHVSANELVMPFDFLNINTNNVSFYVSQALQSKGKNMVITSEYFSLEKALELALFELETKEVKDILVGRVDESLEEIQDFNKYLIPYTQKKSFDMSSWIYLNHKEEGALGKIQWIKTIHCLEELNKMIQSSSLEQINLTEYTQENLHNALLFSSKKCVFTHKNNPIELIKSPHTNILHISMDQNQRFIAIKILKFLD